MSSELTADSRQLQAEHINGNVWVVRPKGCLGTMGWVRGRAWDAVLVKARDASEAIERAKAKVWVS